MVIIYFASLTNIKKRVCIVSLYDPSHCIQLLILKVDFHRQVVRRYGDKCNGAYPKLPDDQYIYQKLMSHLAAAGNYELLGDLMTQLRWLISIVQHGDANTYLADYRHYKDKIPEQVGLNTYINFIHINLRFSLINTLGCE